jgi:hypothetical protein
MDARRLWLSGLALFTLAICGPAAIVGIAPVRADEVTDGNAIADGSLHQSRTAQYGAAFESMVDAAREWEAKSP